MEAPFLTHRESHKRVLGNKRMQHSFHPDSTDLHQINPKLVDFDNRLVKTDVAFFLIGIKQGSPQVFAVIVRRCEVSHSVN